MSLIMTLLKNSVFISDFCGKLLERSESDMHLACMGIRPAKFSRHFANPASGRKIATRTKHGEGEIEWKEEKRE